MRKAAWHGRELPPEADALDLADEQDATPEQRELLSALRSAISDLPREQRRVLVALALDGVPIDVLAERLGTRRDALYEAFRDGRRELRRRLAASGAEVR